MRKCILHGIIASASLLIIYLVTLTALESFNHALQQFARLWYFMTPLVIGFGVQVGLYSYIKKGIKLKESEGATGSVASSGGISGGSMVLCCLHHVTDVLPIIGFSAAALFLSQYQSFFLVLGILSNIVGIFMMFSIMQKQKVYPKISIFPKIFKYDMLRVRNKAIFASGILLVGLFILTASSVPAPSNTITGNVNLENQNKINLEMISNNEGGVSIDATPVNFELGKEVVFDIGINTHQGSLDFDVLKIAILEDSNGNVFSPLRWEGSHQGGHHRYGKLIFPSALESSYIELKLMNIYGVSERIFKWELEF